MTYERLFGATLGTATRSRSRVSRRRPSSSGEPHRAVAPTGEDTPVGRFLARRGPGMHHVALERATCTRRARALRVGRALVDQAPRRGLFGLEVAFVHPDAVHGVLTEVVSGG